jgi:hypothetical protein
MPPWGKLRHEGGTKLYLEVEDTCIAILEALSRGDHPIQQTGVQSEGGRGCQEPAVSWRKDSGEPGENRGDIERGRGRAGEGSSCLEPSAQDGSWGLTQAPLAHISTCHVFTDELGLITKLLGGGRRSSSKPRKREGRKNWELRHLCPSFHLHTR